MIVEDRNGLYHPAVLNFLVSKAQMRATFIILITLLAGVPAMAEVIGVTSNVLKRVKRIVVGHSSGTAFTLEIDGRHYLITAKHVVAAIPELQGKIQICGDNGECVDADVSVLRCDDPIDIAVLVPRKILSVTYSLPATSKGMVLGQDVYFVGFPYAAPELTTITAASETIGFVRKAIWSAQENKDGYTRYYFDGRNNSGFSGSPVVFLEQGKAGYDFNVAAVVSGYRYDFSEVKKLEPIKKEDITTDDIANNNIVSMADGSFQKLVPTGQVIAENTGIVIAYDIRHAIDLVRKTDVRGPEVK